MLFSVLYWLFIQEERAKISFNLPKLLFKCISQLRTIGKIMVLSPHNDGVNFSQNEFKHCSWAIVFY